MTRSHEPRFDRPLDQGARDRIATDLDSNLFVEAGAGAGKTSSLVGRIVALVRSGVDIDSIAAITFTEKAAAELRHRVRRALVDADLSGAADRLDHAPIGTLHAFARRLLNDFPIAAGLPPGFRVLDELESHLAFEERWETLLDHLLDDPDPSGGIVDGGSRLIELCELDNFDLHRGGRRVATSFHQNWDLVESRVDRSEPTEWELVDEPMLDRVLALCETPVPPDDGQAERLGELRQLALAARDESRLGARVSLLAQLEDRLRKVKKTGAKKNWSQLGFDPDDLVQLREAQIDLADDAVAVLNQVRDRRVRVLGTVLGRWVLTGALGRAGAGTIEFHDLLVLARRLVATHPSVRAALHQRYQRILLDEFQDTDPIQLEMAVRLSAAPDDPAHDPAHEIGWTALQPRPGRLFIVGDPKQSIYRFRRADIAQYLRAADQIGADREFLIANFRSSRPVLDWVNAVFDRLIVEQTNAQPVYQRLSPARPYHLDHGSVTVFGVDEPDDLGTKRADELRRLEANDAADAVATALTEGWQVTDGAELRPCRPGDITVLLPARTSLPALELALQARGVPYRAENSSVVYTTTEIRHLMLALRAIADPTDELALVAALRTPLYGCSDVELYDWRSNGGRWSIWSAPTDDTPEQLRDHPVAEALGHLGGLARQASRIGPADLLARLVDDRRTLDVALDQPDARDVWRRVRYVIDQARAWSDAGGHGLRRYLAWVKLLASESRNSDTILPEHDDDAVRIMTVHAAKGLEFPITVLSGMTTKPSGHTANSVVWYRDSWTISNRQSPDPLFEDFLPVDEQMSDAERRRLLYVACTRAIDHLVVSVYRYPGSAEIAANSVSGALLLAAGAADPSTGAHLLEPAGDPVVVTPRRAPEPEWVSLDDWAAERRDAFGRARLRPSVSATYLAGEADTDPGLDKGAVDLDLPPWQRGRYGTAVGRAVHAVLQYARLDEPAALAAEAAAQCAAEGIVGMDDTVVALAESALAAPIVRHGFEHAHHRELFVAAAVGGRTVEGYIDLFVETDGGGIIVDYKTDQWPDDAERADRIGRYRRQLAVYGVVLEQVLGHPVEGAMLVRCRGDRRPAEQIPIDDWPAALADARELIAATV